MAVRRHFPKTGRAKTRVVAKTRGRAKTRVVAKTHGQAKALSEDARTKTHVVAKTRGRAKAPGEDRSGEHTHRRKDAWATQRHRQCVLNCRGVNSFFCSKL